MCKNANKTVASLMAAIEPTLVNLLTVTGIASTPDGQAAITAYNAALTAVQNWVPGTTAQDVVQVIAAFTAVFNTLPFPTEVKSLVDIVSAGIEVVVGVLEGNSSAPAPAAGTNVTASAEEIQHAQESAALKDAEAKVSVLVPGFKRSIFTSPAHQYKNAWNSAVSKVATVDAKYAVLKVT